MHPGEPNSKIALCCHNWEQFVDQDGARLIDLSGSTVLPEALRSNPPLKMPSAIGASRRGCGPRTFGSFCAGELLAHESQEQLCDL